MIWSALVPVTHAVGCTQGSSASSNRRWTLT